jgi:hypothetical protein
MLLLAKRLFQLPHQVFVLEHNPHDIEPYRQYLTLKQAFIDMDLDL